MMTPTHYRMCPQCRKPVNARAKFCSSCGYAMPESVTLFLSYSHLDKEMRTELYKHLIILKHTHMASEIWSDREIDGGKEWEREIFDHLASADLILLLISSNFNASEFCFTRELEQAMERHERSEAIVIPIILKDCDWHRLVFGKLQALPKEGKSIAEYTNRDTAYAQVAREIRTVIEKTYGIKPH